MFGPSSWSNGTTMPSADFCNFLPPLLSDGSLWQSCRPPRVMRSHLPSFVPPHLRTSFPYRYRTSKIIASSSSLHASYAISVRRVSALPAASFRFHLAMDTLAVRLTVPPVGSVGDFHSLVTAPSRAHDRKRLSAEAESLFTLVGTTGFEPATSRTPNRQCNSAPVTL